MKKTRYKFIERPMTFSRRFYKILLVLFNVFNIITLMNFLYYGIYYDDYDSYFEWEDHVFFISKTLEDEGYESWAFFGALRTGHYQEAYGETRLNLMLLLKEPFLHQLNLYHDVKMALRFMHQSKGRFIEGFYDPGYCLIKHKRFYTKNLYSRLFED